MGIKFYDSNGKYWGEYDETRSLFIPSEETVTQAETQNSNLTFEKDECAKEYEELGLKELKELIEADRKTEPQTDGYISGEDFMKIFDKPQSYKPTCNGECRNCEYRAKDGNYCMKTDCAWK